MKRILIVNDEASLLEVCQIVLESVGYSVVLAHGGNNGIVQAKRLRPDLMIIDWVMPDMTGGEVVRRLKTDPSTIDIPVLMMSALDEVKTESFILGAAGFIVKPFDGNHLVREVEMILRRYEKSSAA